MLSSIINYVKDNSVEVDAAKEESALKSEVPFLLQVRERESARRRAP
jgi:hypothetical protein